MTNPTRQEVIEAQLARQWAEKVQQSDAEYERKGRRYSGDPMRAAANFILANTTPPTMAEVEWDDEKHYLAEAETEMGTKVIMLWEITTERIAIIKDGVMGYVRPEGLTPTGKRYTLTEVQE